MTDLVGVQRPVARVNTSKFHKSRVKEDKKSYSHATARFVVNQNNPEQIYQPQVGGSNGDLLLL